MLLDPASSQEIRNQAGEEDQAMGEVGEPTTTPAAVATDSPMEGSFLLDQSNFWDNSYESDTPVGEPTPIISLCKTSSKPFDLPPQVLASTSNFSVACVSCPSTLILRPPPTSISYFGWGESLGQA